MIRNFRDFIDLLMRNHSKLRGKYHMGSSRREERLDKISEHPLMQKFLDYHNKTQETPLDYRQIQNMGVWHHPDGSKHIVARDHGYSLGVEKAFQSSLVKIRNGG